jgi:glycosyltransferase involved in cell wall biosynthesis
MNDRKLISVVTPCYNEEKNVKLIYAEVNNVFERLGKYDYEHVFIDNGSHDETVNILKQIAEQDHRVKIIVNTRNFGLIRSSFYGLIQPKGDAVVLIFCDLQDPPELIIDFIEKWEEGYKIVKGVKKSSDENFFVYQSRRLFYFLSGTLSEEVELTPNFNGFGLYDRQVIEALRCINDPYPYLKGLISEIGFEKCIIKYQHKVRAAGKSNFNFYRMYDLAMLGITTYSNMPLRVATLFGFFLSFCSLMVAFFTLIMKLLFWSYFPFGIAAIIVGLFFMSSVQLFFIGILGEYIGLINKRILKRPLVVERERVNFD